jgi:hypothetical protein
MGGFDVMIMYFLEKDILAAQFHSGTTCQEG